MISAAPAPRSAGPPRSAFFRDSFRLLPTGIGQLLFHAPRCCMEPGGLIAVVVVVVVVGVVVVLEFLEYAGKSMFGLRQAETAYLGLERFLWRRVCKSAATSFCIA